MIHEVEIDGSTYVERDRRAFESLKASSSSSKNEMIKSLTEAKKMADILEMPHSSFNDH
jgi:hypothetical protein